MPTNDPVTTLDARFSMEGAPAVPWPEARHALEEAGTYWLSTVRSDGRPHVTTLIALWNGDALYFSTARGGEAHGGITRALQGKEVAHTGLTKLDVVDMMHERKARMPDLADGFLMLPGGFGTLDEYPEALTWTQLGVHSKPCAVLDVDGYFKALIDFISHATTSRFVRGEHRDMILTGTDPGALLDEMADWQPPATDKWLDRADR